MTREGEDREEVEPAAETGPYRLLAVVRGKPAITPEERRNQVLTFPHLVGREVLAAMLCLALLFAFSLVFDAPLEEHADPALTPNPAKAPWYFSGLQELLTYFDPWLAGVVLPAIIVGGLILIPYLDAV
ncbi:MAG: cytochrome C, partial [Gemmatimonadales bacterium]|nr:cytochrome C [Gemmatimonadales bacterium]